MTQLAVANSLNTRLFKTECVEEMPYEQFRVVVAHINKTYKDSTKQGTGSNKEGQSEKTTYRIVNEE